MQEASTSSGKSIFEKGMEHFFEILETMVGKNAIKMILKHVVNKEDPNQYLFSVISYLYNLLGEEGARAILREIGREVAGRLMKEYEPEKWIFILKKALQEAGYAQKMKFDSQKQELILKDCLFYKNFLKKQNISAWHHPICWIATGFIEEFLKELLQIKGLKFKERSDDCCIFKVLTSDNIEDIIKT